MTRGGYREGAGRKSSWNNPETQLIRVPKRFAAKLLYLARQLDRGESIGSTPSVAAKLDFVTESYDTDSGNDSVTESSCPELNQIVEVIVADAAIAQTDAERTAARRALAAFMAQLDQFPQ